MSTQTVDYDYSSTQHKEIYDPQKLYYLFDTHIAGPYTKNEIIRLYVCRKFMKRKIYIQCAGQNVTDKHWTKLQLPSLITPDWEDANDEFEAEYPKLYNKIVEIYKSERAIVPADIPAEEMKSSILLYIPVILGKVVSVIITIVCLLHCIFTTCLVGIYWLILYACKRMDHVDLFDADFRRRAMISIVLSAMGAVITPPIIVYFAIVHTNVWDEVQSWMISYIVWGISMFLLTSFLTTSWVNPKQKHEIVHKVINAMAFIVGIDFGEHSISVIMYSAEKTGGFKLVLQFVWAFGACFPCLSSLLPAAICGFVANFILEEKFFIKCGDVVNNDVFFKSKNQFCDLISSHDYGNFYQFMGGLFSNIIAFCAVIRLCGYLISKAFPSLALYAKKK